MGGPRPNISDAGRSPTAPSDPDPWASALIIPRHPLYSFRAEKGPQPLPPPALSLRPPTRHSYSGRAPGRDNASLWLEGASLSRQLVNVNMAEGVNAPHTPPFAG